MIYIIAGQTASGKTALALDFAKRIGGHIINGDAFQVYRGLDIGTAKPTKEEQSSVPHHLYDIVDIDQSFSIFDYQARARQLIDELLAKHVPVIITGGSGLYIRSVLFDYTFSPSRPVDMSMYLAMSSEERHRFLQSIDEESASKIHANNQRRVLRAIEIFLQTGRKKSEIEQDQKKTPLYPYVMVTLDQDKEVLAKRIRTRVEMMFSSGLQAELTALLNHYPPTAPGFRAIGYKELLANPNLSEDMLIQMIALNTRQYAKRQNTFFKNQFHIHPFKTHDDALGFLLKKHEETHNNE